MRIGSSLLLTLSVAANLVASDCVQISQREAFRKAFAVFRGTVLKVEPLVSRELINPKSDKVPVVCADSSEPMVVTFKVDRGWKGPVTQLMRVFVFGRPSLGTGYRFGRGERYIVYALNDVPQNWDQLRKVSGAGLVYGIGACPLRVRTDVDKEARSLGKGHPPVAATIAP